MTRGEWILQYSSRQLKNNWTPPIKVFYVTYFLIVHLAVYKPDHEKKTPRTNSTMGGDKGKTEG